MIGFKNTVIFLGLLGVIFLFLSPDTRNAKAATPTTNIEFKVQLGLIRPKSVAFSSDSKYVLSGDSNGEVKLWDVQTGKEIRDFSGHSDIVESVAFSPNSKYVLSGSRDRQVKLWDVQTGKEIHNFSGHSEQVHSVAFSPDSKYVLSGGCYVIPKLGGGEIKLWNIQTGKEIHTFSVHFDSKHPVGLESLVVAFSPNGKYVLSGSSGATEFKKINQQAKSLRLWDIQTGKEVRAFSAGRVTSVAFSPDSKYILSGNDDGEVKLWDVQTGKETRAFSGLSDGVHSVAFSSNGKYALAGTLSPSFFRNEKMKKWDMKLWDVQTGKEIYTYTFSGHSDEVSSMTFSPDGKYALSGSRDQTLKLWDAQTGKEIRTFSGRNFNVLNALALSPSGKYAISNSLDLTKDIVSDESQQTLNLWHLQTGEKIQDFFGHFKAIYTLTFSPDEKYFLSGSLDKTIKLWDIQMGTEIRSFSGHSAGVSSVAFSPNGKYVLSGSFDSTLKLWDVQTAKVIHTFSEHSESVNSVAFSPDGKYILSGSFDKTMKLWNVQTGKVIHTFSGHSSSVTSVAFSPNGKYALSASEDKTLKLWDVQTGKEINTFSGHSAEVISVAFSPDGKYILSGSKDTSIKLWNTQTNKEVHSLPDHYSFVSNVVFSPDGKRFISTSTDKTIKIWDFQMRQTIYTTTLDKLGRYITWTPDGYFDGSPNSMDLIHIVQGLQVFSIDQFALKYNRPDIILERMKSTDTERIQHYKSLYLKRLRKAGLTEAELSGELHAPEAEILNLSQNGKQATVSFKISDSKYPLKQYNIFVNDVPLFGAAGRAVTSQTLESSHTFELSAGTNKIEISALNSRGAESYRALSQVNYQGEVKADLYYLGFGVSEYQDKTLNLGYAHKDALDLGRTLQGLKGFERVHTRILTDQEVTRDSIQAAKDWLKQAKVDDTVVLFIAGHGVYDSNQEASYYYLTHETDLNNLSNTAANFESIEDLLQGIAPRKKLFLMDTCESGERDAENTHSVLEQARSRGLKARTTPRAVTPIQTKLGTSARSYLFEKDRFIHNDLFRRSGAVVFSSSQGSEFSYEPREQRADGNGYFTAAVIEALQGKADKNQDNVLDKPEFLSYVQQRVRDLTHQLQNPTIDRDNLHQELQLPLSR